MKSKTLIASTIVLPLLLPLYLGKANIDLKKQMNSKSERIEFLENERTKLEGTNEKLDEDRVRLEQEKQEANTQVNDLTNEKNSLNEKVNDITNQLNQKEEQLKAAEKKVSELASRPVASSMPKKIQSEPKEEIKEEEKVEEGKTVQNVNWKNFIATAYTTHANGDEFSAAKWGDLTASGTSVKQGRTIAVDKNVIPLGSRVEIQFPSEYSYLNGTYIAEDTGNAIKGNKIDVYLDSIEVANQFGIRDIKLRVL
ncbi:3D domain-containing protein [Bacillus wiedmannii]|uniref:3D domain-containing protein n=1 Tax=Bacillus wiedmannii TaxID=1890302 RepID=UPI000BF20F5B|nr:3D domain-containing protein [Bacillus wiedmannii]PEN61633.1 hypothetical protein CN576_21625 [Bacillus wiedmannii]PHA62879.1 hypothetical protein COE75_16730 [Bacillus wiedmannii]